MSYTEFMATINIFLLQDVRLTSALSQWNICPVKWIPSLLLAEVLERTHQESTEITSQGDTELDSLGGNN